MSDSGFDKRRLIPLYRTLFLDLIFDRRARPILIYVALIIAIGAGLYHWLEGWSWIDSFYFVVITVTTIGYGDLSPTMPLTKIITIFYGLNGVVILLMMFDVIRQVRSWDFIQNPQKTEAESNPAGEQTG